MDKAKLGKENIKAIIFKAIKNDRHQIRIQIDVCREAAQYTVHTSHNDLPEIVSIGYVWNGMFLKLCYKAAMLIPSTNYANDYVDRKPVLAL